ncbi:MAG: hypothetical protein AAFV43_17255 [Planctomycetota bacterium]
MLLDVSSEQRVTDDPPSVACALLGGERFRQANAWGRGVRVDADRTPERLLGGLCISRGELSLGERIDRENTRAGDLDGAFGCCKGVRRIEVGFDRCKGENDPRERVGVIGFYE